MIVVKIVVLAKQGGEAAWGGVALLRSGLLLLADVGGVLVDAQAAPG